MEMLELIWEFISSLAVILGVLGYVYFDMLASLVRAALPDEVPHIVVSAIVAGLTALAASAAILAAVFVFRLRQRRSQWTPAPFSESRTSDGSLPPHEPHNVRGRVWRLLPLSGLPRPGVEAAIRFKR